MSRQAFLSVVRSLLAALAVSCGAASASPAADTLMLEQPPAYGIYFDEYEPTFYTGFAPRTLDPKYLQLHLGRGNQLRVTLVLSDDVLAEYARDLVARAQNYRKLVDSGRLVPTQNRALTTHQRTLTIDHVPDIGVYGYSPWLPYMHVGTRMHNALHTLYWRMKPAQTSFLPPPWRDTKNAQGKPWQYLWLLSRGPMSHGCTHVNAGHQAELRQVLPATVEEMGKVDRLHNRATEYDVFDIDLEPEVMGVRYFIAYSLTSDRPDRLRVRNEPTAYYDWLYGGDLGFDAKGRGVFAKVRDGRFLARQAVAGSQYENIRLYEAAYEPEKIQFYRFVDIPFAKELRQVGLHHRFGDGGTERPVGVEPAAPAKTRQAGTRRRHS